MKNILESFKTQQVKYGGYATLITIAVIAGIILLNLLAGQFPLQLDLTQDKLFSLSEQTIQFLETIKTPVKFYGLWQPGEEDKNLTDVINLYLAANKNISFELIDPDRNPGFMVRYDRERAGIFRGSLIVEGEKAFRIITPLEMYDVSYSQSGSSTVTGMAIEHRITSALLYTATGEKAVVYELTGHSEIPLSDVEMLDSIERENFTLKSLNLLLTAIPRDASVIIMNSPSRDFTIEEAEKILDYLEQGGSFMILADYNTRELFYINEVLASYALKFDYGIVHETDPYYVAIDPRSEWPDLSDHEITKPMADKRKTPVVLLEAMALSVLDAKRSTIQISLLMTSSASSFLRTNLDANSDTKLPADIPGPLALGAALIDPSWVEGSGPQTRIVAIGAGSLLPLAAQGFDANRDLFLNSLNWLGNRTETISIRSKNLMLLPIRITPVQLLLFGCLFVLIIPMSFFIIGLITWLKRRHL